MKGGRTADLAAAGSGALFAVGLAVSGMTKAGCRTLWDNGHARPVAGAATASTRSSTG